MERAESVYQLALGDYLHNRNESALFQASLMSQDFVASGTGPDDIIALHFEALEKVMSQLPPREQARVVGDAHQFLLEVMITYGVKYKEYLELKLRESLREAEARADVERQRALEMERLEEEKAELLASIAHELRTPITAAQGNLDLAVRSLSRGQTERLVPLLGSTREALERLSRLTADLVQVSQGEAPNLEQSVQNLVQVLNLACSWAQAMAAAKGVSLVFQNQDEEVLVECNADAMLSVFGNLLSNAVRYTPTGGSVWVSYGTNGHAWVEVRDSGIGMSPEVTERIFEKFFRGAEARSLNPQGLGLGLSLVMQMVRAHQGQIEVESVPAHGSQFRVVLPLRASDTDGTTS